MQQQSDEDEKASPFAKPTNKASLLREPRKKSTLSIGRLRNFNFTPQKTVSTWNKGTDTDFDMFSAYLKEEYKEEFGNATTISDEVKASLMESKYKMGWPKELWR